MNRTSVERFEEQTAEKRPIVHYVATLFGCVFAGAFVAVLLTVVAAAIWATVGAEPMSQNMDLYRRW